MYKPSQTSASDNVFQLWKCSCLSDFLICYLAFQEIPSILHTTSEAFPAYLFLTFVFNRRDLYYRG